MHSEDHSLLRFVDKIVGPMADNLEQLFGDYSAVVMKEFSMTPFGGLKSAASSTVLASGCDSNTCSKYNAGEVKNATLAADLVIVCVGTGRNCVATYRLNKFMNFTLHSNIISSSSSTFEV